MQPSLLWWLCAWCQRINGVKGTQKRMRAPQLRKKLQKTHPLNIEISSFPNARASCDAEGVPFHLDMSQTLAHLQKPWLLANSPHKCLMRNLQGIDDASETWRPRWRTPRGRVVPSYSSAETSEPLPKLVYVELAL